MDSNWIKVVTPTTYTTWGGRRARVYVTIEFINGRLSITGVEGPLASGNCLGSCGQITLDPSSPAPGWTRKEVRRLREIWDRWHCNDLRPGTKRQMDYLRGQGISGYDAAKLALVEAGLQPDPDTGYSYGSAWLREDVPADVLDWLYNLPNAERAHPWGDRSKSWNNSPVTA